MTLFAPAGRVGLINADPATVADKITIPDLSEMDGATDESVVAVWAGTFYARPSALRYVLRLGEATSTIRIDYYTTGALTAVFASSTGATITTPNGVLVPLNVPVMLAAVADRAADVLTLHVLDRNGAPVSTWPQSKPAATATSTFNPTTGVSMSGVPAVVYAIAGWSTFTVPTSAELSELAAGILAAPRLAALELDSLRRMMSSPGPKQIFSEA